MKKSLLALAVLGAFAGVASAQSSVTLSGTIDLSAKYVKNDGSDARYSMASNGINSSQLVFAGTEDLGGGLKAGFELNSGVLADTGDAQGGTQFWNRRSVVKLSGGFGEIRLGRDYTPTFWNFTIFDAFGTNGLGDSSHVLYAPLIQSTFVRANNSIDYFLPGGIGGLYGQFMVAAGEGVNSGKYTGGRLGWAAGPFDVAGSYAQTGINGTSNDAKSWSIGGSWNLGFMKLLSYYAEVEGKPAGALNDQKQKMYSISTVVPIGAGEIHAGFEQGKVTGFQVAGIEQHYGAKQFALGYVYNVSKRTALYSTFATLDNDGSTTTGGNLSVASGGSITALPTRGGASKGFEFGVRHFF